MKGIIAVFAMALSLTGWAQDNGVHKRSSSYEWPTDELVVKKLKDWQDLKFGVLLHWGIYAVPGIIESWSLCDEDWIRRDTTRSYQQYMDWYNGLSDEFCPKAFDPSQWAKACSDAGMKYMLFTTKHHDGFCMFDSKETDFTIARHAFRNDERRDVLRHVLDAYRECGFSVGTYFSKPDWHSQDYWWDVYGKKGRNVNYPISQYPHRWARFKDYTQRQLQEILSRYGQVDILWLDGGWVNKNNMGQDIDMPAIAKMARRLQPGILIVDRTIHGPYENYQTPENTIPATQLDFPWESCITLTNAWGWVPNPTFKSTAEVLGMLIEIVAKGGNLVLGIGPTASGLIEDPTVERLKEMGKWLKANGEAIYGTTITPHYNEGDIWFTKAKEGSRLYAIYRHKEGTDMPVSLTWSKNLPKRSITLLSTGKRVKYRIEGDRVKVSLPKKIQAGSLAFAID